MEWIDYREKLGISFWDEKKASFFIAQLLNSLDDFFKDRIDSRDLYEIIDFDAVSDAEYHSFCKMTGTRRGSILDTGKRKIQESLEEHSANLSDFLSYYMAFVNCLTNRSNGIQQAELLKLLDSAFADSRLQYAILKDGNMYFVFPKGAAELDAALVSQPLEWILAYPKAHKAYSTALLKYAEATPATASETADSLRKALELFMREFFGVDKSLENLRPIYGNYLKAHGVPSSISNNFETLLQAYTNYMNDNAKHDDRVKLNVLEYILYQTGNVMRLLLTLRCDEETSEILPSSEI